MIFVKDDKTLIYIESLYPHFDYSINESSKYLFIEDSGLHWQVDPSNLSIDFSNNDITTRIDPKSKKCSVVQAVEGRKKDKMLILDSTAGLGRDSFTLAARGHKVIAIEKNPYIFLLLKDALERAKKNEHLKAIAERITLLNKDSTEYINSNKSLLFDCIYIDPMFPERKKSAKVKQNMQIMHNVAFNDENTNELLVENSIQSKLVKKLVVKRPIKAKFLSDRTPSSQIKGKSNRFDIYSL